MVVHMHTVGTWTQQECGMQSTALKNYSLLSKQKIICSDWTHQPIHSCSHVLGTYSLNGKMGNVGNAAKKADENTDCGDTCSHMSIIRILFSSRLSPIRTGSSIYVFQRIKNSTYCVEIGRFVWLHSAILERNHRMERNFITNSTVSQHSHCSHSLLCKMYTCEYHEYVT